MLRGRPAGGPRDRSLNSHGARDVRSSGVLPIGSGIDHAELRPALAARLRWLRARGARSTRPDPSMSFATATGASFRVRSAGATATHRATAFAVSQTVTIGDSGLVLMVVDTELADGVLT